MAKIDFSVVITVLNEDKTINALISSLINQSAPPIEIIVVDAGSSDKTVEVLKSRFPYVKTIVAKGVNRSEGRNLGIDNAVNEHIAVIDAGCVADERWLELLANGFEGNTESVAGFYTPVAEKPVGRLFSLYVSTDEKTFDANTYLPSSRSLAFTKTVWKKVGKYPENLDTCEDLVFAKKLKNLGTMNVRKDAVVYWHQASTYYDFFKQIKGYAKGDIEAHYWPHVIKISTVWLRYMLFLIFPQLFIIYLVFPIIKFRNDITHAKDILLLPGIQFIADLGVLMGSLEALYKQIVP